MATTNSKFLVKNGLAVAGSTGAIDVINTSGQWIGATGSLSGATGAQGASGISGASGTIGVNGATGVAGATGALQNWSVKTTTYTAVNKDSIVANTSGGAFTITLPVTPTTGSSISLADGAGTWATNNLTVARNGSTIEGSATDLILDVNNTTVDLVYDGTTWQAYANIGPTGSAGTNGATGTAGTNGASGATGVGVNGASGIGTNGASGITGSSGATGIQGASGVAGATGTAGTNGATGIQGASGVAGVNGATGVGVNGATGISGASGVASAAATGATGYSGVFNASVYISAGSTGATGFVGSTGTITAPTAYFNSIFLGGTALSSSGGGATITDDTTTNSSHYPTMSTATSGTYSAAKVSSTKLYFNPSTGTLNATIFNSLSDANKKQNIAPIQDAVTTINKLNGVSFEWKDNSLPSYGVIAQEIEEVLPELVNTDKDGVKSVNYNGIIGFLINAIKEQQKHIDELKDKIK